MEIDPPLVFSNHAKRRMSSRGLTEHHVWYCMEHCSDEYPVGNYTIRVCQLPDGRNIKVRFRDASTNPIFIIDAFTFVGQQ